MTFLSLAVLALVGLVHTVLLRLTVRVLGRGAENGWDNAWAYTLVTISLSVPARWLYDSEGFVWTLAILPLCWGLQTIALAVIYEIRLLHAWVLGVVHGTIAGLTVGGAAAVGGLVYAYILYGRIISDPWLLIRLLCRWLGIEPPF